MWWGREELPASPFVWVSEVRNLLWINFWHSFAVIHCFISPLFALLLIIWCSLLTICRQNADIQMEAINKVIKNEATSSTYYWCVCVYIYACVYINTSICLHCIKCVHWKYSKLEQEEQILEEAAYLSQEQPQLTLEDGLIDMNCYWHYAIGETGLLCQKMNLFSHKHYS